ncbi:MAG: tryptophan--tRNA ligase, partial [Actinomycetes bacterium]
LKADVTEALQAMLSPIRERYLELMADPGEVMRVLEPGTIRAQSVAAQTYAAAASAVGLI